MEHKHNVHDSDAHFLIDPIARTIKNTSDKKLTIMQHDHNSERFTFVMPRFVEHDMTLCDRVEIHYINISADKANQSAGIYEIDDIAISAENADNIVFSWLISRNATMYAGTLNFLARFVCLDDDGAESYAWHTGVSSDFKISSGFVNDAAEIIEPYVDVLAQWKASLFGVGDTEEQRLLSVSQDQQAAIDAKGAAVLASIPAEYADLSALADDNFRHKAGAIIQTAAGESITVSDASDYPLSALTVYGKSTQGGTPTPETPAEIINVTNPAVFVGGLQLLDINTHVNFNVSQNYAVIIANNNPFVGGGEFYFSCAGTIGTAYRLWVYDDIHLMQNVYSGTAFEIAKEDAKNITRVCVVIQGISPGIDYDGFVFPVVNRGSKHVPFAPYSVTKISCVRSVRGIPVASGGNYTDENGQQWIADEIDFERGVFVQRLAQKSFELYKSVYEFSPLGYRYQHHAGNGFTPSNMCLCKTLPYNIDVGTDAETTDGVRINGEAGYIIAQFTDETGTTDSISLDILYALAEPIETPLSDVEIAAFRALHTNKPNTTIFNDSGAYMAAEYVADTKTYIDNKISEMIGGENE